MEFMIINGDLYRRYDTGWKRVALDVTPEEFDAIVAIYLSSLERGKR